MAYVMLLAALLVNAAPDGQQAASSSAPAVAATGKKVKAADKNVCRRVVPTGSIMAIRSCRSQKAWDDLTDSGQSLMRQTKDASQSTMGIPPG
jgi:hypothetical protein